MYRQRTPPDDLYMQELPPSIPFVYATPLPLLLLLPSTPSPPSQLIPLFLSPQLLRDFYPLLFMLLPDPPLHSFSHSYSPSPTWV